MNEPWTTLMITLRGFERDDARLDEVVDLVGRWAEAAGISRPLITSETLHVTREAGGEG